MEQQDKEVQARIDRLNVHLPTNPTQRQRRVTSLMLANEAGCDDKTFSAIAHATKVHRNSGTIVLPPHRYESCGGGMGHCCQGRGERTIWAQRVSGGYKVIPGNWVVSAECGSDRAGDISYHVCNVTVGDQVWTLAFI